jgi:hypothetical protein
MWRDGADPYGAANIRPEQNSNLNVAHLDIATYQISSQYIKGRKKKYGELKILT